MAEDKPLVIKRTIDAPVERVWKALTDIKDLKQWLPYLPDFKPEVGFQVRFLLGKDETHQYAHLSKVKQVIENKKLTYSWHYEGYPGYSEVTFELAGDGPATNLTLTHVITEPFPAGNPDFAPEGFKRGWTWTADALKQFVENK